MLHSFARSIALSLTLALPAFAQESKFERDPIEHFAAQTLIVLTIIGIGVLLYSLFRFRGRSFGLGARAFLIAGVLVLPGMTGLIGTVLVFERAEQVDFCASCHLTMKTYVDDLRNPESLSLAALHYKNRYIPTKQCYECHTAYGLHGTVEAKLSGMMDTFKYYTRTYHLPIKMRSPYPNDDCLKCHAESSKWQAAHEDYKEALFNGSMKCMECHAGKNPAHILTPQR